MQRHIVYSETVAEPPERVVTALGVAARSSRGELSRDLRPNLAADTYALAIRLRYPQHIAWTGEIRLRERPEGTLIQVDVILETGPWAVLFSADPSLERVVQRFIRHLGALAGDLVLTAR